MENLIKPIKIRSDNEDHRQATWLELFVDLAYVVGIASLSFLFEDGFSLTTIAQYSLSFFLIFWIWNRFTWHATYYDNGDIIFRIVYLISLFPILGLIYSFEKAYKLDFKQAVLFYVAVNLILSLLWLRVWLKAPQFKKNAQFFTLGYALSCIILLITLLFPAYMYPLFVLVILVEALAPVLGRLKENGKLPVHTSHIIERHGLFSIILLGEGVVSISKNFNLIHSEYWYILILGFIIVIANWWIYFDCGFGFKTELSKKMKRVFIFGYGHFLVYTALLFVSISLEYSLRHFAENLGYTEILPAKVVNFSLGAFLIVLSIIQKIVSDINPKSIYYPRFAIGIVLIFVPCIFDSPTALLAIATFLTLLVLINEMIRWPVVVRSKNISN